MRRRFHYFLLVVLLTALAAAGGGAYRSTTVETVVDGGTVLRAKSRPAHPAQLTDAAPLVAPAQHAARGFFPPGDLPRFEAAPPLAYSAPATLVAAQRSAAGKRYLDHNYPYHAFW
ncbi:hypothetical protein [Flaviaesturariibacter aridisoli]|uniref:Uncharacterized protein n=1 Tax=Flaviaesturariibacter aridisoli TaxID=2545761 RepID=A0A4V2WME3_9BACT|nr:hypothetical protein [Flaviaesturariibacter aridisoli]TCZ68388.1 hypothetical protein E0486_13985 [Flaviaesturariibacter aridisoli]